MCSGCLSACLAVPVDEYTHDDLLEIDEAGKVWLKTGKKIDLSKLSDSMLRKLGIDPRLSKKAKAKLLKVRSSLFCL